MNASIDTAIRQHRTARATLTVRHQGAPVVGQEVVVEQTRHRVLFGGTWGATSALLHGELSGEAKAQAEQRNEYFFQIFNLATLPFYWGRFEPERGKPDTQRTLAVARYFKDHGCTLKGHPLCWHTVTATWLLDLSNQEIYETQLARIRRDVSDFAGLIDMWDVVNEAVIMPVFDKYDNGITRICKEMGRLKLLSAMFNEARAANPKATLLLNDFDMSSAYDILFEACLAVGIPIDVVGIQSHMHQGYWGVEKTEWVLANFERFNLPIHFTETNIVSGHIMPPEIVDLNDYQVSDWPTTPEGEERQAREVVTHYKTLMAHPLVEAITWWDFSDGLWLNAPAGLLRKDMTPKPAYDALHRLIKGEWWLPPTKLVTDDAGQVSFTGFLGDYRLSLGSQQAAFKLQEKGEVGLKIDL